MDTKPNKIYYISIDRKTRAYPKRKIETSYSVTFIRNRDRDTCSIHYHKGIITPHISAASLKRARRALKALAAQK